MRDVVTVVYVADVKVDMIVHTQYIPHEGGVNRKVVQVWKDPVFETTHVRLTGGTGKYGHREQVMRFGRGHTYIVQMPAWRITWIKGIGKVQVYDSAPRLTADEITRRRALHPEYVPAEAR